MSVHNKQLLFNMHGMKKNNTFTVDFICLEGGERNEGSKTVVLIMSDLM